MSDDDVIDSTALLLRDDGSIYHLSLHPDEIADTIILVGDPARVSAISNHFDTMECKKAHREFVVHTGMLGHHRLSVVSTGIGSGGIDIVMNELDALVNIDFATRRPRATLRSLTIIRLGTCGAIHPDIAPGAMVISEAAVGLDGIMQSYCHVPSDSEQQLLMRLRQQLGETLWSEGLYMGSGSPHLVQHFSPLGSVGITVTCPGFYGAQQRRLRHPLAQGDFISALSRVSFDGASFLNLEMETALIYSLGRLLGHSVCSISTVVANRITQQTVSNEVDAIMQMIDVSLRSLSELLDAS